MKILHYTSELDGGGVDRIIYDYTMHMPCNIQVDFVVSSEDTGILETPLIERGSKIYHVGKMRDGIAERNRQIDKILAEGSYDIVHDHSGYKAVFLLRLAKKRRVRCRIAHAHLASVPESIAHRALRSVLTVATSYYATDLFACGNDAGKWMWGNGITHRGFSIMPNAIDTSRFRFSKATREEVRQELTLGDSLVMGCVARFSHQKNHRRLLDIFKEVRDRKANAVLLLVGRGELLSDIQDYADKLGLASSVVFMGVRTDVDRLLNAMDVFVLPSHYEGLPVSLIEVQANGLPLIASSAVTQEAILLPSSCRLSLNLSNSDWADAIIRSASTRGVATDDFIEKWDIASCAKRQLDWYIKHVR